MYFDDMYEWEKLQEVKGMSFEEVVKWLDELGLDEVDCGDGIEIEDADPKDCEFFIDGYWADLSPVIEIEDGHVVRWYRSGAWD